MKLAVAALFIVFGLAACSMADSYAKHDKEDLKDLEFEYEANTVRCSAPGLALEASYLSPDALDLYFSLFRDGRYANPFTPEAFVVFSLAITNKGKETISYNPRMTMLVMRSGEPSYAKDFAGLYALFETAQAGDVEGRMEAYRAACFDTTVTVRPGETRHGLVVFEGKKLKYGAVFMVDSLYVGHKSRTIPFSFSGISK